MNPDFATIQRWIWDERPSLPHPSSAVAVAEALCAHGAFDTAASVLDRAWGANPSHDALRDARATLLDALSVSEHGVRFRYVPAGLLRQGSEDGDDDERPRRIVPMDAFWIADAPLSWAQVASLGALSPPPALASKLDGALADDSTLRQQLVDSFVRRIMGRYSLYADFEVEVPAGFPEAMRGALKSADPRAYQVLPAVGLSWFVADALARARSTSTLEYALPTEAEWERAARGGLPDSRYPWGDAEPTARLADFDRFDDFCIRPPHEFAPNGYGLFCMAGTVSEWCSDWYDALEYQNPPCRNPAGPREGKLRALRGGSWADCAAALRVSFRAALTPDRRLVTPTVGMRPVRRVRP